MISALNELNDRAKIAPVVKEIRTLKTGFALLDILMKDARLRAEIANTLYRHSRLSNLLVELRERPEIPRTVAVMAKAVNVSRPRLYQLFKELTGHPPQDYLQIQRLPNSRNTRVP